jgi:signal transduction histidine kinase
MLPDGRVISNDGPFPEQVLRLARAALQRPERFERPGADRPGLDRPGLDRPGPPSPFDRTERGDGAPPFERRNPPFDRGTPGPFGRGRIPRGDPFRPNRPVPVIVNGQLAGVVVVPPVAAFPYLLRRYAPTLAVVAGGALVVGALLATIAIFGPTRRRLKAVEDAAKRLGGGDLTARVPTAGRDEVAAVAAAFNAMADDLSTRADALAASDKARRQLLADVSHELTTPVTAMRGYLETLKMPELGLDDARRARYLEIIAEETARLEHIIGDLLDLARLEGGGGSLVMDDVPVDQLFGRVVARHERAAQEALVQLSVIIEPRAQTVYGDRERLEQAVQNLAANALRYAPAGTRIELRAAAAADGTISISVSDQGPGIPSDHLPHIFDRFYKVDSSRATAAESADGSTMRKGGSGLGLSIVKTIVERHGGRISVTSEPGRTTFEITGLKRS